MTEKKKDETYEMERHELSGMYPDMSAEDFEALKSDIKANGLLKPIVVHQNQILDGWHRYRACKEVHAKINMISLEDEAPGMSPETFVWSANSSRRHLNQSQRAMLACDMIEYRRKKDGNSVTVEEICKQMGVSNGYYYMAARLKKSEPEMAEKIRSGDMRSIHAFNRLPKMATTVAEGHTMPSAVAELVDNAIDADATRIDITFGRPDSGHGWWMSIADNGKGMDSDDLEAAMHFDSSFDYEDNRLGKYGWGLKAASRSQAKEKFTVVTKCEGKDVNHLTCDTADDMKDWNPKYTPLEPWEEEAAAIESHGTVVLWKGIEPPQDVPGTRGLRPYSHEIIQLERHLALVFHRFLEGVAVGRKAVKIAIDGRPIEPNNPFAHPLAAHHDMKSIRIPMKINNRKDNRQVQVQTCLLPTEDQITAYHEAEGAAAIRGALELIALHGQRNETQGLFIYRHDRLIQWGGWHGIWADNDEKTKLARVIVNFDRALDGKFGFSNDKQSIQLPKDLLTKIKEIADVVRKDSQKQYREEAQQSAAALPVPPVIDGSTVKTDNRDLTNDGGTARAHSTTPLPRVAVKEVETDKFVWKLTKDITGRRNIQVSRLNPRLFALVKHIETDRDAIACLADFLDELDKVGVQGHLRANRDD